MNSRELQVPWGPKVPSNFIEFIREGTKFLIAGHKEPDGDCIGSQLALASVLRRMGKDLILYSAGPFKRTEIKSCEHFFNSVLDEKDKDGARVIIVDCPDLERTGDLEPFLKGLPRAVIDHHGSGKFADSANCPDSGPAYIDRRSPSTTLLVLKLMEALGLELTGEEAKFLFFGLCTDTGFFRHVDGNGAGIFETAAILIQAGANPKAAYADIYGGKSLDSRKLIGQILNGSEALFGGKLILCCEDYEQVSRFGYENRDSDSLYQLIGTIEGVEAIVLICQDTPLACSIGLRSRDWVDVGSIAASFGGGGHKNAASFNISGTIAAVKPEIIKIFTGVFNNPGYLKNV